MKKLEHLVATLVLKVAKTACGAASEWTTYQHKEPASLKNLMK